MKPLNIVFMGSPEFAVPSLNALHNSAHTIMAVVSNPDKRRGRRSKPEPTDVKKRALELGLPVLDVEDVKSKEFEDALKKRSPDLLVVVAFRILPPNILSIPKMGSINLHASLLPKYRGAAPIHWAVINGETETGCTVFFLDQKVDTGNIIGREKTDIGPMETTGDVYERLKELGAGLLLRCVNDIASGSVKPTPQNHDLATPAPKLFSENTRINFSRSSSEIHNRIRGLNPFPIAWCMYGDEKMNLYRSKPADDTVQEKLNLSPGEIAGHQNRLYAGCGDGPIELTEVQLPGTKRMNGRDFINGYDLTVHLD